MDWKYILPRLVLGIVISFIIPALIFIFPPSCSPYAGQTPDGGCYDQRQNIYYWLVHFVYLSLTLGTLLSGAIKKSRNRVGLGLAALVLYLVYIAVGVFLNILSPD